MSVFGYSRVSDFLLLGHGMDSGSSPHRPKSVNVVNTAFNLRYKHPGLVEDIASLARTECILILTSSRPELYDIGSHRKKKTKY